MATMPLFGRAWNIQVLTPPDAAQQQTLLEVSSSDTETQSLRVTFEVEQTYGELWYAEVVIYNPNLQTIQTIDTGSPSRPTIRQRERRLRSFAGRCFKRYLGRKMRLQRT